MTDFQIAIWAAAIGGAGSLAYFSALFFGFIDNDEVLAKLWSPRKTTPLRTKFPRVFLFVLIGAAVAAIFQLPESNLAPIQAFIIGTTWPTIVAQILTTRQGDTLRSVRAEIGELLDPKESVKADVVSLLSTPKSGADIERSIEE